MVNVGRSLSIQVGGERDCEHRKGQNNKRNGMKAEFSAKGWRREFDPHIFMLNDFQRQNQSTGHPELLSHHIGLIGGHEFDFNQIILWRWCSSIKTNYAQLPRLGADESSLWVMLVWLFGVNRLKVDQQVFRS
jgi:hypothetical protein